MVDQTSVAGGKNQAGDFQRIEGSLIIFILAIFFYVLAEKLKPPSCRSVWAGFLAQGDPHPAHDQLRN